MLIVNHVDMKQILTLDCGFGDSGKGKVVNWLCSEESKPIVVRYSGGSQCGHNVHCGELYHEFSTIGSGTFQGAPTYINKGVFWNPVKFLNELDTLPKPIPTIYVHKESKIVTNLEVNSNRSNSSTLKSGSCGQGIFETVKREKAGYHLTPVDLFYPSIFIEKLKLISEHYYHNITLKEEDIELYYHICDEIKNVIKLVDSSYMSKLFFSRKYYDTEIWECNQGLLLDEHIGFMPHCTPTPIIPNEKYFDECYLITRSYHTRHGNGTFNEILHDYTNEYEHNFTNEFMGSFRTAYLDINKLQYVLDNIPSDLATVFNLVINHLDIESNNFVYNGELVSFESKMDFIDSIVEHCRKIIDIHNVFVSYDPEKISHYKNFNNIYIVN